MRKKLKSSIVAIILLAFLYTPVFAADSLRVLSQESFLGIVRLYHPVVKQAGLMVERAKANVLQARGAFDPMLNADLDRKTFDGKLYYSYLNPQLTIPTWYGLELKAGLEEILGTRTSSELTVGQTSYAGAKLNANNIFFDKRRAVLRQAQVMRRQSEAEQRLMINDLLYDAVSAYWNWVREYQNYKILTNVIAVNEERFRLLRLEYEQGSRPAIDTTEALAQLQNFYLQQNASYVAFQNAGLELSNYLWLENNTPTLWDNTIIPDTSELSTPINTPSLNSMLQAANTHPKLETIGFKLDVLQIERKLKAQYLLPKMSVNANILNKGYNLPPEITTPFLENNHKIGFDFSMPLLLREARGGYRAAGIKISETRLEQSNIALQIENKVKSYYNETLALQQQVAIFSDAYINYQKLFYGEKIRFDVGESSLFLLNSRENKMLETAQKLVELKAKLYKNYAGLIWSAGQLR